MNFIAAHWQEICEVLSLAFIGVILIVRGIEDYREMKSGITYAGGHARKTTHEDSRL